MRIDCSHGYFRFTELAAGQMSDFMSLTGLEIARSGDHFTFEGLVDAPEYSLPGGTFLGAPCTVAFAGKPWEVMRANRLVFDFTTGLVVPIASILKVVEIAAAGNFLVTTGMIVPGSVTDDGSRVTDYSAFYSTGRQGFKYSEINYG